MNTLTINDLASTVCGLDRPSQETRSYAVSKTTIKRLTVHDLAATACGLDVPAQETRPDAVPGTALTETGTAFIDRLIRGSKTGTSELWMVVGPLLIVAAVLTQMQSLLF